MDIDVVSPGSLSADQVELWAGLQGLDPALDSPFLSPHWARATERAQGPDGKGATGVAVLHEKGRIRGFFPARIAGDTARPAGAPMSDYQAVVAEPGAQVEPKRLVQALGVGRLDFTHMLDDQQAFRPHMKGSAPSYIVDLGHGYQAYEAGRREAGSGVIKDIDKRRRKVEREIGQTQFTAYSRSRADFDQLIAWKRAQLAATGQTDIFATGWTLRLLRQLFDSRDPDFGGVLFTLHIDGVLAAAHFHLRGRRTIHAWMIAHNPDFERYSPGLMLFQDVFKWMQDTPYARLDFGVGDYRFKQQLANAQRQVAHGFVGVPSPAAAFRSAAYGLRDVAERLPLGKFSELPGKAMRRLDLIRALG